MGRTNGSPPGLNILVPLAAIVLLVAILRYAQDVLVPLCLAILLTFILSPLADWLEKAGLWRIPSVILVSVLFIAATGTLAWMVGSQIVSVVSNVPEYRGNIEAKLKSLESAGGGKLKGVINSIDQIQSDFWGSLNTQSPLPSPASNETTPNDKSGSKAKGSRPIVVQPAPTSRSKLTTLVGPMLGPILQIGIALVLLVFMLVNREGLRNRIFRLVGRGRLTVTTKAIGEAAGRVSRYLIFQSIVNVGYGFLVAAGLHFLHMPNPVLWGVLSGLLRYLPYLGPIIATALPTLLAIGAFPEWHRALYVIALYLAVEIATAYFIEPLLYGAKTRITALSILIAAIFWGVIWGPVGLILSTPLTVCLVAFGKHIPQFEFLTILFGDEKQLSPEMAVYQRLLAGDPEEARDVAKHYLEENSIVELYDSLLIPVLVLAEQDRDRGALDEWRKARVFENMRELVEDLSEGSDRYPLDDRTAGGAVAGTSNKPGAEILAVPARNEGDEIAAIMLAHLLRRGGCHVDSIAAAPLTQIVQDIAQRAPAVLCISALPPLSLSQARRLYRKVKSQSNTRVIIGIWTANQVTGVPKRIGLSEPDQLATSLADCAHQVQILWEGAV